MPVLEELQSEIQRIRVNVGRSVVGVGNHRGAGSGVVIEANRVLTNAHNVWGPRLNVTFPDGSTRTGTVAAADIDGDIAVIEVDTADAPVIGWQDAASAEIGSPVFALSNPAGRGLRVTFGFVSGTERAFRGPRGRRITGSIEHTAPLLPGSSGGPTVDAQGNLVGINTNRIGEGFYLAIPADASLRERVERLSRGEAPKRRTIGVALAPAEVSKQLRRAVGLPDTDGLLVRGVEDDSPAARAGLAEGDLLTAANGTPLRDADVLHDAIARGGALELTVLRGAEARTVTIPPA